MVDEISSVGSERAQQINQAPTPNESAREGNSAVRAETAPAPSPSVEVELSESIKRFEERAQFDEARVKELKSQIEQGTYPIDTQKLAEKFSDLEQLL